MSARRLRAPREDYRWNQDFWVLANWPCPTLRHLGAVYRDHPDYDEAWKS